MIIVLFMAQSIGKHQSVFITTCANVEIFSFRSMERASLSPGAGSIAVPLPEGIDGWNRALAVAVSGPLQDITRRRTEIVALLNDVVQRYLRPSSSS